MAQIQGTDQHFIPRVDHYNQSGQIMAEGLADFGAGLGSAVKAFTVKQEEAKAEKQRSEGVADLLMQFYPGQFKDRKAAVKMAKDPDVTNAFFKFSQQQQEASAAAAKERQEIAQQSFENATKVAEGKREYYKHLSDMANTESQIRDRKEDNVRADRQQLFDESEFERIGKGLSGPAKDLQDLHTLKDQYVEAGQTEKASDVNSLIVSKTIQSGELPEKAQMMEFFIEKGMAEKLANQKGITIDEAALDLYKDISSRPLTPRELILLGAWDVSSGGPVAPAVDNTPIPSTNDALEMLFPK